MALTNLIIAYQYLIRTGLSSDKIAIKFLGSRMAFG